jgi:DNA polymerase V
MPKGGKRAGAGRPLGRSKYGLGETKQIRIPVCKIAQIQALLEHQEDRAALPLYASQVQAGFPSPADDYIERYLDLNSEFIKHPASTFVVRATGDSMREAGIFPGDYLLVDRSLEARDGKIVIAAVNGELTVKRLSKKNGQVQLLPANPQFKPIDLSAEEELVIWGVVTLVLHQPT